MLKASAANPSGVTPNSPLNNFTATTNPGTGDDTADGYGVGSYWYNVTLDLAFVCLDATANAAVWRALSRFETSGYITGTYLCPLPVTSTFAGTPTADRLVGFLASFDQNISFSQVAVKVSTAQAGKSIRVGVYTHDEATKLPTTLITETAAHELDSTTDADNVINLGATVTAGPHRPVWLFSDVDSTTAQITSLLTVLPTRSILAANQSIAIAGQAPYRIKTHTFGALPDPIGVTTVGVIGVDAHCPIICVVAL